MALTVTIDGWAVTFRPLHPSDVAANGVQGRVQVTAIKGSRVTKQVIDSAAAPDFNPATAWKAA